METKETQKFEVIMPEKSPNVRKHTFKIKLSRKLVVILIVIAALLIGYAAAWISGRSSAAKKIEKLQREIDKQEERIQELIDTPLVVDPITPEISLNTIYKEIAEIGELASAEYLFTNSARFSDYKQIKDWNIPLTQKAFTLKWDGVIKAGVDLNRVVITVNNEEMRIYVTIPQAEILSYSVDNDSVEVLDEKNNLFNKITIADKVKFDAETEKAMIERAISNGLLEKAQKNAEVIIYRILTADRAIGTAYTIEFFVKE